MGKVSPCLHERDSQAIFDLPGYLDNKYLPNFSLSNNHTCSMTIVGPEVYIPTAHYRGRRTE